MEAKSYTKIPPKYFVKIRKLLASKGVTMPEGNTGMIKNDKLGIDLGFTYDGLDVLTIQIVKKPFLIPASMIWNELEKAFKQHVPEPKVPRDDLM